MKQDFLKDVPVEFLSHLHNYILFTCSVNKFLKQQKIVSSNLKLYQKNEIKKCKGKNNLLLDPIEQNA